MTQIAHLLTGITHTRTAERFVAGVEALERFEAEGLLTKSEHEALKYSINNGLDSAFKTLVRESYTRNGRYQFLTYDEQVLIDSLSWPQSHTVAGYQKRVLASKKAHGGMRDAILAFLEEAAPIGARVMAIKAKIGKRVKGPTKAALERQGHEMTCQICARGIFANTGAIAHHGYQRPGDGWQTASCPGAKELPYEADRTILGKEIVRAEAQYAWMIEHIRALSAEELSLSINYQEQEEITQGHLAGRKHWVEKTLRDVTRANWDAKKLECPQAFAGKHGPYIQQKYRYAEFTFDTHLQATVGEAKATAERVRRYIADQTKRYETWIHTHSWSDAAWAPK